MRRQDGLTLLEMVVVLLISGMALAIGYQSLAQWRRADTALASLAVRARQDLLTERWLHESLRGLVPVKETPFAGDETALSGTSLNPVTLSQGATTPIAWKIETGAGEAALVLEQAGQPLRLPLQDVASARFEYFDTDGKSYPRWPPALGTPDALPASIALVLTSDSGTVRVWASQIAGIRNPVQTFYEVEQD